MEITDDDYFLGMWFCSAEGRYNWQCTVMKKKGKGDWIGEYRHRYIVDDKVFNSKDRKSFYTFSLPASETEENITKKVDELSKIVMEKQECDRSEFVDIRGNGQKMLFKLAQCEWASVKRMSKEDAEKEGLL